MAPLQQTAEQTEGVAFESYAGPDDAITVTLEYSPCGSDEVKTATLVLNHKWWITSERPGGGIWYVMDPMLTSREIVDELYSYGRLILGSQPWHKRVLRIRKDWDVWRWTEQHVDFAVRPSSRYLQQHPGERLTVGASPFLIPIIKPRRHFLRLERRKHYLSNMEEGFFLNWKITAVTLNKDANKREDR